MNDEQRKAIAAEQRASWVRLGSTVLGVLVIIWAMRECSHNLDAADARTRERERAGRIWCRQQEHEFKKQCLADGATLTRCRLDWNWVRPKSCP